MVAYAKDPVSAPKVASDFAKGNEKFVILGGAMGKTALDSNGVKALAALPSLDQLRARLIGTLKLGLKNPDEIGPEKVKAAEKLLRTLERRKHYKFDFYFGLRTLTLSDNRVRDSARGVTPPDALMDSPFRQAATSVSAPLVLLSRPVPGGLAVARHGGTFL